MKVIEKLQQGGGMPSFVSFTNISQPQVAAPYTTTSDTSNTTEDGSVGLDRKSVV